jgi:hypothetical protein
MCGSLIFSKNHRLQVFEKSEPKNLPVLGIWGKKSESKNNHESASDISKPSKNQWFDERTIGSLQVLWLLYFLGWSSGGESIKF